MTHYRFTRPLEGSPEGAVRKLTKAEVEPLLNSGAVEEIDDDVTAAPDPAGDDEDKTITTGSVGETKEAVAAPRATRSARATN
jgi:hypothetical protein